MESLPVKRKSCLLRLRENCPFRKLCRQKNDVSAATSSPICSYWNNIGPSVSNQPISTVYSEPLPPLSMCQSVYSSHQSEAAAEVHMEEDPPSAENQQSPEFRAADCMGNQSCELSYHMNANTHRHTHKDLEDDVDPETGERAQG